jgi:lipoprotein-anchoring transpeptidase ErfK/SrfK
MNRQRNALRQLGIASACVLGVGVAVTIFGLSRSGGPSEPKGPEASQQVALARKFVEQGEPDKALAVLDQMREKTRKGLLDEGSELLRLQALDRAGMHVELASAAPEFLERFPSSKAAKDVKLQHLAAEVATAGLSQPALIREIDAFLLANPEHPGVARLQLALARHERSLGDPLAARRRLEAARSLSDVDAGILREISAELGDLNLQALMTGAGENSDLSHTVASGESIWVIARKHGVTPELLMRANNITDPKRLRAGQTLRVPNVDFSLHCDVSTNEMVLYNHGKFFKTYTVRTGRVAGTTPTGEFRVLNKKTDPTWRPGDGRVYGPGDPNNELGTRWMAFEGDILGIHGTLHPETVGHYASNGCIGLTREDVEELFDLIEVGTPLVIIGSQDLTQAKVIPAREVPPPQGSRSVASAGR